MIILNNKSIITNAVTVNVCGQLINFPGGEIKFFEWLRRNGYLQANNLPYQKYKELGWFTIEKKVVKHRKKNNVKLVPLVTILGMARLERKVLLEFPPCNNASLVKEMIEKLISENQQLDGGNDSPLSNSDNKHE